MILLFPYKKAYRSLIGIKQKLSQIRHDKRQVRKTALEQRQTFLREHKKCHDLINQHLFEEARSHLDHLLQAYPSEEPTITESLHQLTLIEASEIAGTEDECHE